MSSHRYLGPSRSHQSVTLRSSALTLGRLAARDRLHPLSSNRSGTDLPQDRYADLAHSNVGSKPPATIRWAMLLRRSNMNRRWRHSELVQFAGQAFPPWWT